MSEARRRRRTLASPLQLFQLTTGYWITQALAVAAELELADLLVEGPLQVDVLAERASAHSDSLYRLLRALSSVGVFAELPERSFELNPLAQFMRRDHAESVREWALLQGKGWHWQAWGRLADSVRSGVPAMEIAFGEKQFDYLARHDESRDNFSRAMTTTTRLASIALLAAYDFSRHPCIADIGGAHGELLLHVLEAEPACSGILFDLPEVIASARQSLPAARPDLAGRIEFAGGSFFESFPAGADAYLLKFILHDWDDESCIRILRQYARVGSAQAPLLIVELVLPEGPGPSFGKLTDLEMMALNHGGRERTEGELTALVRAAGLTLREVHPTHMEYRVLEVIP